MTCKIEFYETFVPTIFSKNESYKFYKELLENFVQYLKINSIFNFFNNNCSILLFYIFVK